MPRRGKAPPRNDRRGMLLPSPWGRVARQGRVRDRTVDMRRIGFSRALIRLLRRHLPPRGRLMVPSLPPLSGEVGPQTRKGSSGVERSMAVQTPIPCCAGTSPGGGSRGEPREACGDQTGRRNRKGGFPCAGCTKIYINFCHIYIMHKFAFFDIFFVFR